MLAVVACIGCWWESAPSTRRIAFLAGSALGVIVAALGVRVLQSFVDSAQLDTLSSLPPQLFGTVDVALTRALLGGGAQPAGSPPATCGGGEGR